MLDYGIGLDLKMPEGTRSTGARSGTGEPLRYQTSISQRPKRCLAFTRWCTRISKVNRITGLITFWPTWEMVGIVILCDEKVFQFGDAIAIICADTYENACAAAEKVKVDLEVLPAYMSARQPWQKMRWRSIPERQTFTIFKTLRRANLQPPIFEKSPYVVEDDFYVPKTTYMTIEPDVGFAYRDDNGVLKIHSKTIGAHLHLLMCAQVLA